MIRFCDKEVITLTLEEYRAFDKIQLAMYLMDEKSKDCPILLYDDASKYYGMLSYESCCSDEAIVRTYFVVGKSFWNDAKKYFAQNPNEEMPVFDANMNLLSFCYFDKNNYSELFTSLNSLGELTSDMKVSLLDIYAAKLICIHDFNELAWNLYQVFVKYGYPVFVIGEGWEWFGISNEYNQDSYFMNHKMYIYAEGRGYIKKKAGNIKNEFGCLQVWLQEVSSKLFVSVIDEMLNSNIKICKVMIPNKGDIDIAKLPKKEVLNYFRPISATEISSNKSERCRQKDFFGEEDYQYIKNGELEKDSWDNVVLSKLVCQRMMGINEKKRIYLIGACTVGLNNMLVKNTLVARLQQWVGKYGYEVVRCSIPIWFPNKIKELKKLPIREKDICVFVHANSYLREINSCYTIDLTGVYNRPRTETWTNDGSPVHTNGVANKVLAKEIFYRLLDGGIIEKDALPNNVYIQKGEVLRPEFQQPINAYIDDIKRYTCDILIKFMGRQQSDGAVNATLNSKIGSIVMNCNPFTKGHQYLIEQAASQVDYLYIFVVQEDKSFFTFEDRFELVKAGTAHLENVIVVPSGEYVLSYKTLPIYFEKEEQKTVKIDASYDVEIFARYIAPRLGITCRFAGEEPIDMVTRQYNEQMAYTLPEFGIEFIEIPRKVTASDQEVISASRVRKLMKEQKWEEIRELVPDTTYEYLKRKFRD